MRRSLAAAILFASGCASLPADRAERNLFLDLRKSVELSEGTEWIVDSVQLESNLEDALHSVCQVMPERRANLAAWIGGQIMAAGGTAESQFAATGDLDGGEDALRLERVRALLLYADARAASDCPFWLQPREDFDGVQGGDGRAIIMLESMGSGRIVLGNGDVGLGGGGGGRILAGYRFDRSYALLSGIELGGGGSFVEKPSGGQTIETVFNGGVPILLRMTSSSRIFDLEIAAVSSVLSGNDSSRSGVRLSMAGGIGTMRQGSFMPYLLMWLGYEHTPGSGSDHTVHTILLGSRVGLDWLP